MQTTLAREDVYVRPDAAEKALHEAFLTALGRVSETLGHDGRVTSLRDDLVTLDFGLERGLAVGSRVELGLVVLSASHPASGEILRSRKVTTHIVEVLDARAGSSIARIARRNPIVVRQAASLFAKGHEDEIPLLAWRHRSAPALSTGVKAPWETAREVETTPLTGTADIGFEPGGKARGETSDASFLDSVFGRNEEIPQKKRVRRADSGNLADDGTVMASKAKTNGGAEALEASIDEGNASSNPEDDSHAHTDNANVSDKDEEDNRESGKSSAPRRRGQEDYRLLSASGGLGMTFGILGTDRGDRYTDFPATILNTVLGRAHIELPSGWETKPEIVLRLFSGGDVEGSQFALSAPVLTTVRDDGKSKALVGGEVEIGGGSVKTIRVKKSLSHFALLGVGEFEVHVPGVGEAEIGAGLSVFGLFGGHLEGYVRAAVSPSSFLPKPLSLYGRLSAGPEQWSAFDFGALWQFHGAGH